MFSRQRNLCNKGAYQKFCDLCGIDSIFLKSHSIGWCSIFFRQKSLQFSHSSPFTHFVTLVNRRLSKETYLRVLWKKIISADHLSNCGAFYDSTSSGRVWNHFLFCDAADFPDEKVVFIITDRSDEKVLLQLFRSSFHAFSSRCTWICTQSCKEYWWSWCSNALLQL